MSIVSVPERKHECAPGWRDYYVDKEDALGFGPGWYSEPPHTSDFPAGTVWECECGQTWVSLARRPGAARFCYFRRERRRERRRRERRQARTLPARNDR